MKTSSPAGESSLRELYMLYSTEYVLLPPALQFWDFSESDSPKIVYLIGD
jgi:hypothetical protein